MSAYVGPAAFQGGCRFACVLGACFTAAAIVTGAADSHPAVSRDRPPAAHTGGFGEPTCRACHFDGALNEGPGSLAIEGLPDSPEPGHDYVLTVSLVQPGLRVAGFQLAIRRESDGSQAGALVPAVSDTARVAVTAAGGVQYAHHTWGGAVVIEPDTATWKLRWTAPAKGEAIVVHAVANASDDDSSPLGDFIYARSRILRPPPR